MLSNLAHEYQHVMYCLCLQEHIGSKRYFEVSLITSPLFSETTETFTNTMISVLGQLTSFTRKFKLHL